jgi:hypothetical protein
MQKGMLERDVQAELAAQMLYVLSTNVYAV